MTDPDRMVPLGEIATRDGIVVKLHRDYEDLMLGDLRLTPDAVAALEDKIAGWKQQVNDYMLRADEAAADDGDIPERCASHGGEGDGWPGCPGCADEDERRRERGEFMPCDPEWSDHG